MLNRNKVNLIYVGKVYKISYLAVVGKKRKVIIFTGLCISLSKDHSSFTLRNIFNTEMIELVFSLYSPIIISINLLNQYKFRFTKSKLFFKKLFFIKEALVNKISKKVNIGKKKLASNYILPINYANLHVRYIKDKYRLIS